MTAIINRAPTGRLISLHTELRYLHKRYGEQAFELKGLKYDAQANVNPLTFFPLAVNDSAGGTYDPYLTNPRSPAKFHLTQSIQYDMQKSKSASECLNALEALGWVKRLGRVSKLTPEGFEVAAFDYHNPDLFKLLRESVLGYGVFIGFLYKCLINLNSNKTLVKDRISVGYQDTKEFIVNKNIRIPISSGSKKDTIVRTRSALFGWAISTGFALPNAHAFPTSKNSWHIDTLDEIKKQQSRIRKVKMFIEDTLFDGSHVVSRPLSYHWMTKSTKALRERGQHNIRLYSLREEEKIKNRRFAIVYCLALCSENGTILDYDKFTDELTKHTDLFVINTTDFKRVMNIEKDIAIISGIPFSQNGHLLKPLTRLDLEYLKNGAPIKVIEAIENALNNLN